MCLQLFQTSLWEGIEAMHPDFLKDNNLHPSEWKEADSGCTVRLLLLVIWRMSPKGAREGRSYSSIHH